MLVEIPDPEVILGVILAFLIGLGGLYLFFKIRPFIKSSSDIDVISKLSEQISVINDSDIFPEREDEVISVIERLIRQASNM